MTPTGRARLVMVAHTFVSAGTYLMAAGALATLDGLELAWLRFLGAGLLFFVLLRLTGRPLLPPPEVRGWAVGLALVGLPLNQGFFLSGLKRSTPTHAAILYALTPACVLLGGHWFLGERISRRKAAGVAIAFCGVLVVMLERGLDLRAEALYGDLLLLLGVVAWAVFTVWGRPLVHRFGALTTSGWVHILGAASCLLFGPFLVRPLGQLSQVGGWAWAGLLYLIVGTSFVAYLLWTFALKRLPSASVAVFTNFQPVATALLTWLFLGRPVSPGEILGGVLVIAGITTLQT